MAVVSNKPDSAVEILCGDYFPGIFSVTTGEVAGLPRKPAPELVLRAAKALGVEANGCVYIGDSEVDVQTARNAGMRCISVLWGFRDRDFLEAEGADCFCRTPAELPRLLKKLEESDYGK